MEVGLAALSPQNMSFIAKIFQWLIYSSNDPQKVSLTVKMAGLAIIPTLLSIVGSLCGFHVLCIPVDADWFNQTLGFIVNLVEYSLYAISALVGLFGLLRKLYLSLTGQNKVVQSWG